MTGRKTIAVGVLAALAGGASTATASKLITGKDIKPGSITSRNVKDGSVAGRDVKKGTITLNRLSPGVRKLIAQSRVVGVSGAPTPVPGQPGANGQTGAQGQNGAKGENGAAGQNGAKGDKGDKGEPAVTQVNSAGNGFTATNPSVAFTNNGVTFGPYADSSVGGSMRFQGAYVKGMKLRDLARAEYTASYTHSGLTADNADAPYLRVFIDNDGDNVVDHDVVFSPSTQPGACYGPGGGPTSPQCTSSGRAVRYVVQDGTVRYDDDAGSGTDEQGNPTPYGINGASFARVVADHGSDTILAVLVTTGFSLQGTSAGKLNSLLLEVDGKRPMEYAFGS